MFDRFHEEVYGRPEWFGYRSIPWIVFVSLLYGSVSAWVVFLAVSDWRQFFLPAASMVLFSLWRIYRLHVPLVLVCREELLLLAPGKYWDRRKWSRWWVKPVYFVTDYSSVFGFSNRWDELYLGMDASSLLRVPVLLGGLSQKDRKRLWRWIEEKQQACFQKQE